MPICFQNTNTDVFCKARILYINVIWLLLLLNLYYLLNSLHVFFVCFVMKTLHKYFQSGCSYKLAPGTPFLPENLPVPAANLLRDTGWALHIEWNLLTPEKLLQQFQQFFTVNKLNAGAYLVKLSNNKLIICSADPAGCFYGISSAIQQIKTSPLLMEVLISI